jgi:protocatechuate 3,4-dioxygenase beta subunit
MAQRETGPWQPGAPLQLTLEVVRAGDCATLANARVDVWHAASAVRHRGGLEFN